MSKPNTTQSAAEGGRQAAAPMGRRRLFAGAGAAGALAAAAAVLPRAPAPVPEAKAALKPAPEGGGGYQLTAHVQRYYDTTKI